MQTTISLNGIWEWYVPGGQKQTKIVPSCYHCVGDSYYERDIELDDPEGKLVLRFEGIHYEGNLWLNGHDMGEILPYTRYEFDVTSQVKKGTNRIKLLVKDITAEFGPTSGWESYGGISRDVFLDIYTDAYISDTQWITCFNDDYKKADCTVRLFIDQPEGIAFNGEAGYRLSYNGVPVYEGKTGIALSGGESKYEFTFTADSPVLWSCDLPNLYTLTTFLQKESKTVFEKSEQVGFREFKAEGSRFLLNGVDTHLKGVCRHEMWGDHQGFTLSKEQIEQDFKLIKLMGANYVRLVHYPHCAYTMEVCDRLGIMVSAEPGLWWSDFNSGRIADKALEIMKRTVKRDRNRASVIFWLLFNECIFASDYPYQARVACRELDPTRLVSAANCMPLEETKEYFKGQELDFYTFHAYGHQTTLIHDKPITIDEVCTILDDMPLVFTEWGGWYIHNNDNLITMFREAIAGLSHNRSPEPNLAGIAWWQWNDIYELNRGLPGVMGGILNDGLVDKDRNVKPMYQYMAGIFRAMDEPLERVCDIETIEPGHTFSNKNMKTLCLGSMLDDPEQIKAWKSALEYPHRPRRNSHNKYKKKTIGPVMPHALCSIGNLPVDIKEGRPVVFNKKYKQAELPVNEYVSALYVIGQVTFCEGYPMTGDLGSPVMTYELVFEDGTVKEMILKNGVDFSSSSLLHDASRINPVTANTGRVIKLDWESNWEVYQVCWETFPIDPAKKLKTIRFKLDMPDDAPDHPLLYGVTVEIAGH